MTYTQLQRMVTCSLFAALLSVTGCSGQDKSVTESTQTTSLPLWGEVRRGRPSCVRGIHLTSWYTGNKKARASFEKLFSETELNTAVIDIKETEGDVYIPGISIEGKNVSVAAMPDIKEYLNYLKDRGVYTIARIVVFKDEKLPKIKPEWAIKSSSPMSKAVEKGFQKDVWVDSKGLAWADPYNKNVWNYIITLAEKAVELGFQEIQFDYIRFPSDGQTKKCVYSKVHTKESSFEALASFLEAANKRLKKKGADISIDVFGLAGSYDDGLGIGQKLSRMLDHIDSVSPMVYPSHYAKGEYGIKDPNNSPYETVFISLQDTQRVIGKRPVKLIPYLQDFSLGVKYNAKQVRDQIQAANDLGIHEWLLWNPACKYTKDALYPN